MKDIRGGNLAEARTSSRFDGRSPYLLWLVWLVWLPLIIPTVLKFLQSHPSLWRLIATLVGVVLFFAIYLWSTWRRARYLVSSPSPSNHVETSTWLAIAIMALLSFVLMFVGDSGWQALFFYTCGYAGGSLPIRRAIVVALALMLLSLATGWLTGLTWFDLVQSAVFIPAIVFITKSVMWSITTSWELRAAREEIARLAVMTERLRIARDLHDLLGHNLSLITLKSELAGRLITRAPERAAAEISDIEQVARTTLQEVREAVASYRQPSLASELQAAREILAAAGISYHFEGDEESIGTLPTTVAAVLAWTVREAVTNVIRHSRARQCSILVRREKHTVSIEIVDDGIGTPAVSATPGEDATSTNATGNGLRGLAERVAALGGEFAASPRTDGGFRLSVSVPRTQKVGSLSIASRAPQASPVVPDHASVSEERSLQS